MQINKYYQNVDKVNTLIYTTYVSKVNTPERRLFMTSEQLMLRVPPPLKEYLKLKARNKGMTLNGFVIEQLWQYKDKSDAEDPTDDLLNHTKDPGI